MSAAVVNANNGAMLLGEAIAALAGHCQTLRHAATMMFGFAQVIIQDTAAACRYSEVLARVPVLVIPENSESW